MADVEWNIDPGPICRPCSMSDNEDELWSLFVEPNGSYINIFFMSPYAPHHLLAPGREFTVYDGKDIILLRGRIII